MPTPAHILRLRECIGHDTLLAVGAAAAIFDAAGRVLLGRRSDAMDRAIWGFPGGAMEPGESVSEGLRREVLEEAGLDVTIGRLIGVYSRPEYAVTYPNGDHTQYVVLFFECQVVKGEARPDDDEMLEWRYFGADELPALRPCCVAKAKDAFARCAEPVIR
ncbi:MAG TPA: NUDIX domain-containing protein [Chloroflexota bacterium]|nr:NUDIX domain-containing protein [Chloroflexota bacterium]